MNVVMMLPRSSLLQALQHLQVHAPLTVAANMLLQANPDLCACAYGNLAAASGHGYEIAVEGHVGDATDSDGGLVATALEGSPVRSVAESTTALLAKARSQTPEVDIATSTGLRRLPVEDVRPKSLPQATLITIL
jgi:hypothetical protein